MSLTEKKNTSIICSVCLIGNANPDNDDHDDHDYYQYHDNSHCIITTTCIVRAVFN